MIISVHIPKTAGSSFGLVLKTIYGKDLFLDYGNQFAVQNNNKSRFSIIRDIIGFSFSENKLNEQTRCIHGHFRANKYENQFEELKYIAWIRHPVKRVISHYYHFKNNPNVNNPISTIIKKNDLSLAEFASMDNMYNLQCRYLGNIAIENYYFIGIQDYYERFLLRYFSLIKMKYVKKNPINVNLAKKIDLEYKIDKTVWEYIAGLNKEDFKVYNAVVKNSKDNGII